MSNRTLLEINHDYWVEINARPKDFIETLLAYLSGGSGRSNEALERYGVRIIAMRHHSEQYHVPPNTEGLSALSASAARIRKLEEALGELLEHSGYTNHDDASLRHEAELGNGFAPVLLRARAALKDEESGR